MQTLLLKVLNSLLPCPTVHRDMLPSHSQDTSIQSHWSVPVKQFQESGEITKETPCLLTDLIAQLEQSLKKSRITEAQSLADILRLVSTGFCIFVAMMISVLSVPTVQSLHHFIHRSYSSIRYCEHRSVDPSVPWHNHMSCKRIDHPWDSCFRRKWNLHLVTVLGIVDHASLRLVATAWTFTSWICKSHL